MYVAWAKKEVQALHSRGVHFHHMNWDDVASQRIYIERPYDQIEQVFHFIESHLAKNTNVLVHCAQGKSRSATVVIAYLMMKNDLTFEQALHITKQGRVLAEPNEGFAKQLKQFERRARS
jgi:protein-tyrosine phosphatase